MGKIAIGLAGLLGSGKSTAAEIIVDEIGRKAVATEVSDYVRACYETANGASTDDNSLGEWAEKVKDEAGESYFLRQMTSLHAYSDNDVTVFSGLRSPEEAEPLYEVFDKVIIIAVWTLPDIRFERKYGSTPSEEHPKWKTFVERNEREKHKWNCLEYFIKDGASDYVVSNNDAKPELRKKLHRILEYELRENGEPPTYPIGEGDRLTVAGYV